MKQKRRPTAPDGKPYPPPVVAVAHEEQRPWLWGWAASAERDADRSIVHAWRYDEGSDWLRSGGAPFHLEAHAIKPADYWLIGPNGPVHGYAAVERKERDAASTFTAGHDRFEVECDALRMWTSPLIVCSCSIEELLRKNPQHEASIGGTIMAICSRDRIPVMFPPSRSLAERLAGWFLRDRWEAALAVDPAWLAWARDYDLRAEQARLQRLQDEGDAASARSAFAAAEGPQVEEPPMGSMPWAERQRRRQASR